MRGSLNFSMIVIDGDVNGADSDISLLIGDFGLSGDLIDAGLGDRAASVSMKLLTTIEFVFVDVLSR
jgi:hypothetical protein